MTDQTATETYNDKYAEWLNRDIGATETFDRQRFRPFDAMLDRPHDESSQHIAPMSHLMCFLADVEQSKLGPDGHAARGDFLPPIPLPRRMWAGGRVDFIQPIEFGSDVTRRTRIKSIHEKTGKSGLLVFVTTEHEFLVQGAVHLRDEQSLVFRDAAPGPAALPPGETRTPATSKSIDPTPVLLFRYSAITYNSHRIHFDREYTINEEHYPGLIVHGPLQATFLAEYAQELTPNKRLASLTVRAQRPIFDLGPFTVNAAATDGDKLELWTADHEGFTAMSATATFT